jgi:rhodanese-related sulfurtransferase
MNRSMQANTGDGRPVVPEVSVQEADDRFRDGSAVIIDVREPSEIVEVSVPGTINIPLGQLAQHVREFPADRELLFFCRSGNRSSYATDFAIKSGFPNSANVAGGIIAWVRAGLAHQFGNR